MSAIVVQFVSPDSYDFFLSLSLFIGIAVSFVLLVYRASTPHVAELGNVPGARGHFTDLARHADDVAVPGLVIIRPEPITSAELDVVAGVHTVRSTG